MWRGHKAKGRLLWERSWGQGEHILEEKLLPREEKPAKQTLGGNVPGPQRACGEKWCGMFEGPKSQGAELDKARKESLGKGLAE